MQLLLTAAVGVHADDYTTEQDLLLNIPVLSGVTHLEQRVSDTPASVTIIDRRTIDASTASTVADLFRLVPGFQSYLVNGSRPGVNYHSLGDEYPRRLEVKIDGRSVYESLLGAVVWPSLGVTLDDIERIEIVRGPNAPADGSNAFLGSVNIVTRNPVSNSGWRMSAASGNHHFSSGALSYAGNLGEVAFLTRIGYRHHDGFDDSGSEINNDSTDVEDISLHALWTPSARDSVEFQIGGSDSSLGIGDDGDFTQGDYDYSYQYLHWTRNLASGSKFQVLAYHNEFRIDDEQPELWLSEALGLPKLDSFPDDPAFGPLAGRPDIQLQTVLQMGRSERWDLEVRHSTDLSRNFRTVFGAAARKDTVSSEFLFDQPGNLDEHYYRAYNNLEWRPGQDWVINAGVIGEYNDYSGAALSYRFAGNYSIRPDHVLRIALNRGERTVSLLERNQRTYIRYDQDLILDAIIQSAPDIDNELIKSAELGYNGLFWGGHLRLDAKLFYESLDDIMSTRRDQFPFEVESRQRVGTRDNVIDHQAKGAEFQFSYRPDRRLLVEGSYAYISVDGTRHRATYPVEDMDILQDTSPRHSASLLIGFTPTEQWALSAAMFHQGSVKYLGGDSLDAYTRFDLKLSREWQSNNGNRFQIALLAQNVTEDYLEYFDTNTFKTAYVVEVKAVIR